MRRFTIGNFTAICEFKATKNGFRHICRLSNGRYGKNVECRYINRTWEKFEFESVILKSISEMECDIIENEKSCFKALEGIRHMSKQRGEAFEKYLEKVFILRDLQAVKQAVKTGNFISVEV